MRRARTVRLMANAGLQLPRLPHSWKCSTKYVGVIEREITMS